MRWEGKIKIFPEIVPEMNVYVFNYIHFVCEM